MDGKVCCTMFEATTSDSVSTFPRNSLFFRSSPGRYIELVRYDLQATRERPARRGMGQEAKAGAGAPRVRFFDVPWEWYSRRSSEEAVNITQRCCC